MMSIRRRRPLQTLRAVHHLRDQRGVALPTALLCLLALTLLVTGVLLTASTDAVTSLAQQTAAEDLYAAEGAIEAWISARAEDLQPEEVTGWTPPGGTVPVWLSVERLARWTTDAEVPERITVFSIHAEATRSLGGGRAVVALVRIREEQLPLPEAAGHGDGGGEAEATSGSGPPEAVGPSSQAAWGTPRVQGRTFGWFEVVR